MFVFFFKQKTAYEMRISYWSSDVCSSDLSRWRSQLRPHSERPLSAVCSHKPILKAPVLRHPPSHCTSASERTSRSASWQIGRASCRERVCQYVSISVVAVSLNTKNYKNK